jgi:hypothetical protein
LSVIILVADGARPDTLTAAIDDGALPALARLRAEGGLHTVTSTFPSVTGPAYTPFLMGRYPGPVGLPGLRWFDRARAVTAFPHFTRSYVGAEMRHIDRDLDPDAPTMFELASPSLAALNVIGRGLSRRGRMARGAAFAFRAGCTHFSGNVRGWLGIDRDIGSAVAQRIREEQPRFAFAALTGVDKASHAEGHQAPVVRDALRIVDDTAAQIRDDAERDGRWDAMQLWVVSDHGHSRVQAHEDLAGLLAEWGYRTVSHPWVYRLGKPDAAVMVSGNAMAHLYLELWRRERPWWPELRVQWEPLVSALLQQPSVDLMLLPHSASHCEVRARGRGTALVEHEDGRYAYRPLTGDPLAVGGEMVGDAEDAYDATVASDYPDSIVQIAHLAGAARAGEIILSAARDWDFRARYEPIPHVSSHGALHREHMLVPLLVNRPVARRPRRTVDVMPSALTALGIAPPVRLDGEAFN